MKPCSRLRNILKEFIPENTFAVSFPFLCIRSDRDGSSSNRLIMSTRSTSFFFLFSLSFFFFFLHCTRRKTDSFLSKLLNPRRGS
ncbi:hypothetical protein PUN28_003200 [Cardiocondyla obscurior]|uniref:Transmembrane protein n=1 Tax=Cardiocondyla obscurior TaxID=286306 RepID=A0AAW2GKT3_9HYME